MYICSRCVARDASASARCAAASPARCRAAGSGCITNGLVHVVIATPQCAMAHVGSAAAILSNAACAATNQNECSMATARSKSAWTAGAHDVGKETRPRASAPPWPSCCDHAGSATSIAVKAIEIGRRIGVFRLLFTEATVEHPNYGLANDARKVGDASWRSKSHPAQDINLE